VLKRTVQLWIPTDIRQTGRLLLPLLPLRPMGIRRRRRYGGSALKRLEMSVYASEHYIRLAGRTLLLPANWA
jgi:hypothetical protein